MTPRFTTSTAIFLALTTPAFADITADDVWGSWLEQFPENGANINLFYETEEADDSGVTVQDMMFVFEEGDTTITLQVSEVNFDNLDDGSVAISSSLIWPITIDYTDPEGDVAIDAELIQNNVPTFVTGSPGDITYSVEGTDMVLALSEILFNNESVPALFQMELTGLDSLYRVQTGDLTTTTSALSVASLGLDMDFNDPETGGKVVLSALMQGLTSETSTQTPTGVSLLDPQAATSPDFAYSASTQAGPAAMAFETLENGSEANVSLSSTGSAWSSELADGAIALQSNFEGLAAEVIVSDLPLPISIKAAALGLRSALPLAKSDTAQPFGLGVNLDQLEISEFLWSMVDPAAVLPRDAATLRFDLDGTGNWFFDLMNPENVDELAQAALQSVGEVHSLTLKNLQLSLAGAELTGEGDFAFDNTDTTTFGGFPVPTGALGLKLVGGNGLLDKLAEMGLLPQEQAFGARMMLGMFTVPQEAADTLTSRIEVKDKGQVFANGQRLR